MCTLIIGVGLWPEQALLVAANRDEKLDRPAAPPSLWHSGSRKVWAPKDLSAGGTWLGLNDAGLFVGITNRFGNPPDSARASRGALVMQMLAQDDHRQAAELAAAVVADAYNPFHLVMADRQGAALVYHDGQAIQQRALPSGWHVITERSLEAGASARPGVVEQALTGLGTARPPDDDQLQALLADHEHGAFDSVCVHVPDFNYGTRSSTILRLLADPTGLRFRFADGPPCETSWQDLSEAATTALA